MERHGESAVQLSPCSFPNESAEHRRSAAKPARSKKKAGFVCCISSFDGWPDTLTPRQQRKAVGTALDCRWSSAKNDPSSNREGLVEDAAREPVGAHCSDERLSHPHL